jgi:hypothetical protein
MTKQAFIDLFYIGFDEVSDFSSPGITPLELSKIASKAQEELILTTYDYKSNRIQEGFEESEKRIEDLGELVRYKSYTSFSPGFLKNSVQITLPNTLITVGPTDFTDVHWLTIFEDSVINKLDCSIPNNTTVFVRAKVDKTTHAQLGTALKDPFRKPYFKNNNAKVLELRSEARKYLLITDGSFSITEYILGYIRKPIPIDLTTSLTDQVSELSEVKHKELLDATINHCLKITRQIEQLTVENQIPKE